MSVVKMKHATQVPGGSETLLTEKMRLTPAMAAQWLRANKHNRPLTKSHVNFLANELISGNWQFNGSPIVIADDESVLDGQHRLHAVIESGVAMDTLVVYGIAVEAFRTIDTGKNRSGSDVLALHHPNAGRSLTSTAATASRWSLMISNRRMTSPFKVSNTDLLAHLTAHQQLWHCAETVLGYPKDGRPLSPGPCAALYYHMALKDAERADSFMQRFHTGAGLEMSDAEYILRQQLHRDAHRSTAKLPLVVRMRMVIKAWNLVRRGKPATRQAIVTHFRDESFIEII
jgi:hypothetical protein